LANENKAEIVSLLGRAIVWFLASFVLIVAVLASGPFVPAISDLALPIVGLLFLIAPP
jgi:hypothetical protein